MVRAPPCHGGGRRFKSCLLYTSETEKEPVVLPSRFPNLLVNGTQGIAVGMATNIPPHNLREVISAVDKIIEDRMEERITSLDDVISLVKGPDFPTGAMILGKSGIQDAYRTGRGKIKVRAITDIEPMQNGKHRIIVTELPLSLIHIFSAFYPNTPIYRLFSLCISG